MEVLGYKYTLESEAIQARKECADYYGLPTSPDNITIYWVDYFEAVDNTPVFWYIVFDESVRAILGNPTTFDVDGNSVKK
tara:strand:+ start:1773 stop:2012 length:240 start_codon:yes stop_codon:yes gene_type:complete